MKPFAVPEIIFKGHSRSLVMLCFVRSPGLSIAETGKCRIQLFSDKIAEMT